MQFGCGLIKMIRSVNLSVNNRKVFQVLEETGLKTQIWMSFPESYFEGLTENERMEKAVNMISEVIVNVGRDVLNYIGRDVRNYIVVLNGKSNQPAGAICLTVENHSGETLTATYSQEMAAFSLHKIYLDDLFPALLNFPMASAF